MDGHLSELLPWPDSRLSRSPRAAGRRRAGRPARQRRVAAMPVAAVPDFLPALPEIALAIAAMLLLLIGVFRGESSTRLVSWLAVLVLIGILLLAARLGLDRRVGFYGMFVTD